MAGQPSKKMEFNLTEVSIIYSALGAQRAIWARAQRGEVPNGPVFTARQVQMDELTVLMQRFTERN